VKAKAIRIIVKSGYPAFRVGLITGKSEVEVSLSGTPWVGSVNFDFPHHPYKILTSNDGNTWKLAVSGINTANFYFNPTLHTSYIKLDYQDETCDLYGNQPLTADQIKALGFKLVRRNGAKDGTHLHPAKDRLLGNEVYGSPCTGPTGHTCNRDFSTSWSNEAYDEFLFTTGDLKHWVQVKKSQVLGWYEDSPRTVLCSSDSKSEHTVRWYRRSTNFEDPFISIKDFHSGETQANVAGSARSSECARGGVRWYQYDDKDGHEEGRGVRRHMTRGDSYNTHQQSHIDSAHGWSSCEKNRGHWLQFDLGSVKRVKGIVTQARRDKSEWVGAYKVRYSSSDDVALNAWKWASPRKGHLFEGNDGADRNAKVTSYLLKAVEARYVRIYPVRWNSAGYPGMRADVVISSGVAPIFLYGENSVEYPDKTRASREHQALNVYIRMSPKRSKTPELIPVKFEGYTADPGKLMYPDSKPRLDACGDATKKKEAKEKAVEDLGAISEKLTARRKDIIESVEFLNEVKSIRERIDTFQVDYSAAFNDTIDWSRVLIKANLPLTTLPGSDPLTTLMPEDDENGDQQESGGEEEESEQDGGDSSTSKKQDEEDKKEEEDQEKAPDDDGNDEEGGDDKDKSTAAPGSDKAKADEPRFIRKGSHLSQLDLHASQEMF